MTPTVMESQTVSRPRPAAQRGRISPAKLLRDYGLSVLVFLLLLGIWEAASRGGLVKVYILPAPDQVVTELWNDWGSVLRSATWVTFQEMFLGFLIAVAAGLAISVALHWSKVIRRALYPLLIASQAIPIVVLAPILAIIIGYNISSKLVIVALVCFFPIAINTLDGLRGVDAEYVRMMRTLHGTRWLTFRTDRAAVGDAVVFLRHAGCCRVRSGRGGVRRVLGLQRRARVRDVAGRTGTADSARAGCGAAADRDGRAAGGSRNSLRATDRPLGA